MFKKISLIALCFSLIVFARIGFADPTAPGKQVIDVVEKVRSIVSEQKEKLTTEQLDEKLKEVVYPVFDFDEMSKRGLGANWNKVTAAEQEEFVRLFSDLLAHNYLKKIREAAEKSNVSVVDEAAKDGKAVVKTNVQDDSDKFAIDYRLHMRDARWKVYDVIIENVGLVNNYRSEFADIIRKEKMSGLLAKLREKSIKAS